MDLRPTIPDGYHARALTLDDAEAVADLLNAYSRALTAKEDVTSRELRLEWTLPGWDPRTDALVVEGPDRTPVGYAELWDARYPHVQARAWARVHPDHRGRGLGAALLDWMEARAARTVERAPPNARVTLRSSVIAEDEAAHRLFTARGWRHDRTFYRMRIDFDAEPHAVVFPEGLTLRTVGREEDLRPVARAVDEAFSDHWGHVPVNLEEVLRDWNHWREADEECDTSLWFLLEDGSEIAGMSICSLKTDGDPERGWIHTLGVLRPWRRRGLGLALLRHSFRELYFRGQKGAGLAVDADSLTGAIGLYEKAGMCHVSPDPAAELRKSGSGGGRGFRC